jgi:hypothetical protein
MPSAIGGFTGGVIDQADWKSTLRHIVFLLLESLIAGSLCCFVLFILNFIPTDDTNVKNNIFLNVNGFATFSALVWLCIAAGWPFTLLQGLFHLDRDTTLKMVMKSVIPGMIAVLILVFGITVIDNGKTFNFYYIGLLSIVIGGIVFAFSGKIIKSSLRQKSRMPLDVNGFYRCLLFPSMSAMVLASVYGLIGNYIFRESSLSMKFVLRLVVHPLILEGLLTFLRWLVFKVQFANAAHLSLLLVPGMYKDSIDQSLI